MERSVRGDISRRTALQAGSAALGGTLFAPMINRGRYRLFAGSQRQYSARTLRLIERSLVMEGLHLFGVGAGEYLANPDRFPEEQLQKYRESKVDVFHITAGAGGGGIDPFQDALIDFGQVSSLVHRWNDHFVRVTSIEDLESLARSGKIGVVIGFQNSDHFRTVDDVDLFHGLGQRISQLTYNSQNRIGTGCMDRNDQGISDFGADVIQRMNGVGMAVDVSHCGDRTTLDALDLSRRPVLMTHSNVRALNPGYPRNKTDEAIRKMAARGGVIGMTSIRSFVRNREPTTIEHLIDHYDHVKRLVGVDHLGIGSDHPWEGQDSYPKSGTPGRYDAKYAFREKIDMDETPHPKRTFEIVEGLVRRGWSDAEIEPVLGANFRRVLGEIWADARASAKKGP